MLKTIFPSNFSILPMRVKPLDSAHKPYFGLNSVACQKDSVHFSGILSQKCKSDFFDYIKKHPDNSGLTKQDYMRKMRENFLNDPTVSITSPDRDNLQKIQSDALTKWYNAIKRGSTETTPPSQANGRIPPSLKKAFLKYFDEHSVKDAEGEAKLRHLGEMRKAFVKSIRDDQILASRFPDTDLDRLLSLQEATLKAWVEKRD